MNNTTSRQENVYCELESVKKETEADICDEVAGESATPVTQQTSFGKCMHGADKKRQASTEHEYAWQSDTVVLRRMLFVAAAVAALALLIAIAALILALTAKNLRNDSTAKVQGEQNSEYFVDNLTFLEASTTPGENRHCYIRFFASNRSYRIKNSSSSMKFAPWLTIIRSSTSLKISKLIYWYEAIPRAILNVVLFQQLRCSSFILTPETTFSFLPPRLLDVVVVPFVVISSTIIG